MYEFSYNVWTFESRRCSEYISGCSDTNAKRGFEYISNHNYIHAEVNSELNSCDEVDILTWGWYIRVNGFFQVDGAVVKGIIFIDIEGETSWLKKQLPEVPLTSHFMVKIFA